MIPFASRLPCCSLTSAHLPFTAEGAASALLKAPSSIALAEAAVSLGYLSTGRLPQGCMLSCRCDQLTEYKTKPDQTDRSSMTAKLSSLSLADVSLA